MYYLHINHSFSICQWHDVIEEWQIWILAHSELGLTSCQLCDLGSCELSCCCSVTKLCQTLCDPMDCRTSGFPVHHCLLEFAQTHVHWFGDAIQPSHSLALFSSCPQSFPASGSFPVSWLFTSGGQSIRASASASILSMNIQDWFPLGLTGLISLLSKGFWRVFASTTIQKHQFFSSQLSL